MAKSSHAKSFEDEAESTAEEERTVQRKIDRSDKRAKHEKKKQGGAMQAGARVYPEPPLPSQHLEKPGQEADLELEPMYDAPALQGLGEAVGQSGADHRWGFGYRPRGRGAVRPRGRRRCRGLSRRA